MSVGFDIKWYRVPEAMILAAIAGDTLFVRADTVRMRDIARERFHRALAGQRSVLKRMKPYDLEFCSGGSISFVVQPDLMRNWYECDWARGINWNGGMDV